MTFLHLLAWTGVAIIGLGCAFGIYVIALGVLDRLRPMADAEPDDDESIVRSQFAPYVPEQYRRREAPRDTPPPSDPAS